MKILISIHFHENFDKKKKTLKEFFYFEITHFKNIYTFFSKTESYQNIQLTQFSLLSLLTLVE